MARKKIALIGAGQIGGTLAHLVGAEGTGRRRAVRHRRGRAAGQGARHRRSPSPVDGFDAQLTGTNDYAATSRAPTSCIVTAGVPRKPGMSRDDLLGINLKVMDAVGDGIKKHAPDAFVICITNPLDAMVWALQKFSGLPHKQGRRHGRRAGFARASATSWPRSSTSRSRTSPPSCSAAMATPWCRWCATPPSPASRCPTSSRWAGPRRSGSTRSSQRTRDGGAEIVDLLKTGSAFYAPAASRDRDGRELSPRQEARAALRRVPQRRVRREGHVCRRAGRDRRQRRRADRRDRTRRPRRRCSTSRSTR